MKSDQQVGNSDVRALVVIHDLAEHNAHLMPWRTVCEVVRRGRETGNALKLVSLSDHEGELCGRGIPSGTVSVSKERNLLARNITRVAEDWGAKTIIWPLVWREPGWRSRTVGQIGVPVIGYFPGGVYRLADTLYAVKRIGLHDAAPYLLDAIWPKRLQSAHWRKCGFSHFITMTSVTADAVVNSGWTKKNVSVIPPGRDGAASMPCTSAPPDEFEKWREGRPYYLFAGPPSGIRGIYELLQAFDDLAGANDDICLVCLFRSDAELESARLADAINDMSHKDRVYSVWSSLEQGQLRAFMSACHAVVLPFVAVPSEIPLAIIEVMQYGKPVITTKTGGSGQFVREFGEAVPLGSIRELAKSMSRLLADDSYYQEKCKETRHVYASHPTWEAMTGLWLDCIRTVLSGAQGVSGRGDI